MTKPLVTIVVPTYNEERNIRTCLNSIRGQSYRNIEMIVIDSKKSKDKTYEISKEFTKIALKFGRERSQQRNFGAKVSKGKYILFIDADMQLEKGVVAECVSIFSKNSSVKAVIIPEKSYGESFWAKCKALEKNCYIGDDKIEAARFFERKAFLAVDGFNENMISGEDWDLTNRIKERDWKVERIKSLIHHNEGRLSLIKDIKKKYYYATKSSEYIESNIKSSKDIFLFLFRPAYLKNWKMLVSDPLHTIGFIVMKILEFSFGAFGVLVSLKRKVFADSST